MKLNVLICTFDKGIERIPSMLLPPRNDVSYIVSMQYTDNGWLQRVPESLSERKDVSVYFLQGRGLSRNRNNALAHADGDVALIADDDCRYRQDYFDTILRVYTEHPDIDIIQFKINAFDGVPIKKYATYAHPYAKRPKGMYPTSPELTLRVSAVKGKLSFNERFGLGSGCLFCGEEDVFLHDAMQAGLSVWYFPYVVVDIEVVLTAIVNHVPVPAMDIALAVHIPVRGRIHQAAGINVTSAYRFPPIGIGMFLLGRTEAVPRIVQHVGSSVNVDRHHEIVDIHVIDHGQVFLLDSGRVATPEIRVIAVQIFVIGIITGSTRNIIVRNRVSSIRVGERIDVDLHLVH